MVGGGEETINMTDYTFFAFWVGQVWGSQLYAFFGTAFVYSILCVMARMSHFMMLTLLALYGIMFSIGFMGFIMWFPLLLLSFTYFSFALYKFLAGSIGG